MLESVNVETEFYKEVFDVEKKFEARYSEIWSKVSVEFSSTPVSAILYLIFIV